MTPPNYIYKCTECHRITAAWAYSTLDKYVQIQHMVRHHDFPDDANWKDVYLYQMQLYPFEDEFVLE